jgi:maltose alpha-D-glucosyltransferase / alpha-amylase
MLEIGRPLPRQDFPRAFSPKGPRSPLTERLHRNLSYPSFNSLHHAVSKDTVTFSNHGSAPSDATPEIPHKLKAQIEQSVTKVFGREQAPEISRKIFGIIRQMQAARPPELIREDISRKSDWYKDEVVYMMYPERFGVKENGQPNTFRDLIPQLSYLKELGATTLYILPPFESPQIDAGFDISNYKKIRQELGGNEQFEEFLAEARKLGIKIKLDLVLNHVSDQHKWAKQALNGDPKKLNYFLVKDRPPAFELEDGGKVAIYHEDDGTTTRRAVIFPEISTGHYRKVDVNGQEKFFYHTFYPHQLDVNHQNPEVLYKFLKVMGTWANRGVDIFRLDAAPFYVKTPGTNGQGTPETHAVIQILSSALQAISPRSVLWAEACESPINLRPFYGEDQSYEHSIPGQSLKQMNRTDKVQVAYHFPQMVALWSTMLSQSPRAFWQVMKDTPPLPESAAWGSFHSVHDEKTMEVCKDPVIRQQVYEALIKNGESFREGEGVSGRLANFMEGNTDRIKQMNAILFSLPGIPIIYYGDEIGETNNRTYMLEAARKRELQASASNASVKTFLDSRDVHRAPISQARLHEAANHADTQAGQIHQAIQRFITVRKQEEALTRGKLTEIPASQENTFSYLREYNGKRVLVVHNLSGEAQRPQLELPSHIPANAFNNHALPDLLTGALIPLSQTDSGNNIQFSLAPYQSVWLKIDSTEQEAR